jgi:hypothetical protein
MKINKLIFDNNCYPRGRDKLFISVDKEGNSVELGSNEIKPDSEVVKKYQEYIQLHKKIPNKDGNITYNKRTMHILDGWHRTIAAQQEGWTDIPDSDLTALDIPIEKELWVSAQLNNVHGKQLSRPEIKAVLKQYWEKERRLKYGTLKEFRQDFAIPESTLHDWLNSFGGESANTPKSEDSTKSDQLVERNEEKDKLKEEVKELQEELTEVKADARKAFWEMICETHQEAIKGCKKCGN